ncbi:MAG: hypothetical protein HS111_29465 [Kofleriaceae bacterium]|nr:hypothetical protein [Kofleriaceae bacterium]
MTVVVECGDEARGDGRIGRGLSAFDTPSLALGRLRPTGEMGLAVRFPRSPTGR